MHCPGGLDGEDGHQAQAPKALAANSLRHAQDTPSATAAAGGGEAAAVRSDDRCSLPYAAKTPIRDDPKSCVADMEKETASVVSSITSSARSLGTQSSVTSEFINERLPARQRETTPVQHTMKRFVRTMVRGQQMGVVSPDGQMRTCTCSLDKKLKHFVIELKGSTRKIPLSSVSEVYQGKEPEDIDTPLDELCSTLTLALGECITFHFPDVPARENFAMCLQILVDGQQ